MKLLPSTILSLALLLFGIALDNWFPQHWFSGEMRFVWYLLAYVPVGMPVLRQALGSIRKGAFFSEFLLMGIATIGAFAIGEYPEGVAVMLFYSVGEVFQSKAVERAKSNIRSLLDQRPDEVTVLRNGLPETVRAETVRIGETIRLRPGEKLALDGELLSEKATFNTSALTGESMPAAKRKHQAVLAGMINLYTSALVKVTTAYTDSKLSRILALVQDAASRKAPTERFIRRFAKIYTPVVVCSAAAICLLPSLFVADYRFAEWLYRALVFLVVSCPCALVVSIPLGYFGGIGMASRNGILVKGGNFLDALADIRHIVMDKTGTLTEGIFSVQEVYLEPPFAEGGILQMVNALESHSTHPVATAIGTHVGKPDPGIRLENVREIAGRGMMATVDGKRLLVGNFRLMDSFGIQYDPALKNSAETTIGLAYGDAFAGFISIADGIKADARQTIARLHDRGIKTTILSGDKSAVVRQVADRLGIADAFSDLLPEDKVDKIRAIKARGESVAFVGDGVNDAPVVALSDVGIAMGGLGSEATIETADVVIQDDRPLKIPLAIAIGKRTKKIVWQNIALAFGVKAAVLILGASGLANMWEAVFADVGVALLAILNAVRVQHAHIAI